MVILSCSDVSVGLNLSEAFLSMGHYAYIGSANIKRPYLRVLRHLMKGSKKLKWHIDYLTKACNSVGALLCSGIDENTLYEILIKSDYVKPSIKGFGCSDYKGIHETHLFKFNKDVESLNEIISYFALMLSKYCVEIEIILS
ncbi:MAG: DUF123 domain-containing protein [Thermoprotei archaeon]